ncbi:MAG TPA: TRAP transporter small permease subunit [Casimicrobiaceae bacterium]|nr:TRAP transporter small permease subunit [Casimicrobiaceae bacterium]
MTARWFAAGRWLRERAENVAVALIATMFICFLLQIAFRYLLNRPLGWTEEVTVLCWVWVVLWCAAFVLSDDEEVRFDIVYNLVPKRVQRTFTVISSIALIVLLLISLPATWRYVTFMKREHSAFLHMRFDFLYSIYLIFAVACIVRHCQLVWSGLFGRQATEPSASDRRAGS